MTATDALHLAGCWPAREASLAEHAERALRFLATLRDIHPIFTDRMQVLGDGQPLPDRLDEAAPRLRDWGWDRALVGAVWLEDLHLGEAELGVDPDPERYPYFRVSFNSLLPDQGQQPRVRRIEIAGGAWDRGLPAGFSLDLPRHPTFESAEFLSRLIGAAAACWPLAYALVTSATFRSRVELSPEERQRCTDAEPGNAHPVSIGWLTYFGTGRPRHLLPAEVAVQDLEPFGQLIRLDGSRLDPSDERQVAQAIAVRDALRAAGLLGSPATARDTGQDRLPPRPD